MEPRFLTSVPDSGPPTPPLDPARLSVQLDDAVATARASGWTDRLEAVMTDGYAEVLRLENERRRARERLVEVLHTIASDPKAVHVAAELTDVIADRSRQIDELHALLDGAARRLRAA